MKEKTKTQQGITLIALVITIIVLLILAGITIVQLTENGLFGKAEQAVEDHTQKSIEEEITLLTYEYRMANAQSEISFFDFLSEKGLEIEDTDNEDQKEIIKDGYSTIVDKNGNIISTQKIGPRPQVDNTSIKITLEDGTELTERQSIGTKLKIVFNATIQGGTITSVSLPETANLNTETGEISYITNGNEQKVKFEISGTIGEYTSTIKKDISLEDYYEIIDYNGESLLDIIANNTFENDKVYKILANDLFNVHVYNLEGNQTISENTEYGDENDVGTSSTYAQNMVVVKVNGDLTINQNVKVTAKGTEYGGPKGLLIYCTGKLTNNGTISMTARGAYAPGQEIYLYKNSNNSFEKIPESNTNGGAGTNRSPGCGGRGGSYSLQGNSNFRGGYATSYSGGAGAGGRYNSVGGIGEPSDIGGKGGGMTWYEGGPGTSGGAGNPGGSNSDDGGVGSNGTGGLLVIYASSFENNNLIESDGSSGGNGVWTTGGGSGGGSINIFARNIINKGQINANGGKAGSQRGNSDCYPSNGGAGSISIGNISTGTYVEYTE